RAALISGHVTDLSGNPIGHVSVSSPDASLACCHFVNGSETDASGNYSYGVPQGATVKVQFSPAPGTPYLGSWWNNKDDFNSADAIRVDADTRGINAQLGRGFFIRGHVTDRLTGLPLQDVFVDAKDGSVGCCRFVAGANTNANGDYELSVPPGSYVIGFNLPNSRYVIQLYRDTPFFYRADRVLVVNTDVSGIDAAMRQGVFIRGRVTTATGSAPVAGLNVSAQVASGFCCQFVGGSRTDLDGQYTMVVPSGEDVKVEFGVFNPLPGSPLLGQWYRNKPDFGSADPVRTSSDQYNIDASLESGFLIRGTVTGPSGPVANIFVSASLGGAGTFCCQGVGGANTDATGQFQIRVRSGTYRIQVNPQPSTHLQQQWWNGVPGGTVYFDRASDIVVGSADATGKNFTL